MSTEPTESPRYLGRYELVHPLGQGGMGEVFLAKIHGAAGFEKPCIIKTVLPTLLKDRQFLDRFHHEAKVLVHLVHSSIAQVYDMGEADGTYFMALEYVAGVDLAYLLEQARARGVPVPVPVALFIGQRMAEGLGYAHRKAGPDGTALGIVHRDVSPHNVMVSYEGEVKVIDFGLAKSAARSKYTLPSTVMGKLGYMSPEQVRAEALDHRSDIYSCGVVLWEMLAGRPLIPHGTVGEMMAAMSQPVVPELPGLRPEVDGALDAVVRRALTAKPDERYGRSDELARALTGELVRSGAQVGAEEVGQFVRSLCPEAFETQRQLIAKVTSSSSHRRTPAPGTGTGVFGTGPQAPVSGFEATMMRSLGDVQPAGERSGSGAPSSTVFVEGQGAGDTASEEGAAVTRRPSRPVPTAQAEEAEGRRRPMGLYAAIAVLLVIATAATTALLVGQPAPGVATRDATAAVTGTAAGTAGAAAQPTGAVATGTAAAQPTGTAGTEVPATGTAVAQPTGTVATGATAAQPTGAMGANAGAAAAQPTGAPGANAPVTGTPATAEPTGTVVAGTVGAPTPGTTGAPATGSQTPAVGTSASQGAAGTPATDKGTQVAVAPTAGSGSPDKTGSSGADAGGGKVTAPKAKPPTKKKPAAAVQQVRYLSPADVLPVVDKNGKVYVDQGTTMVLRPDMVLDVVGPPQKNGKRVVLGKATVLSPPKGPVQPGALKSWAFLKLDESALAAEDALFVSLSAKVAATAPEKPEAATATAQAPATDAGTANAEPVKLYGHVEKLGGMEGFVNKDGVKVFNSGTTDWTECRVVKDLRKVSWLGIVKHNKWHVAKTFKFDANYSVGSNMVSVICKEGQLTQELED